MFVHLSGPPQSLGPIAAAIALPMPYPLSPIAAAKRSSRTVLLQPNSHVVMETTAIFVAVMKLGTPILALSAGFSSQNSPDNLFHG